jgi:hypothetical protein
MRVTVGGWFPLSTPIPTPSTQPLLQPSLLGVQAQPLADRGVGKIQLLLVEELD